MNKFSWLVRIPAKPGHRSDGSEAVIPIDAGPAVVRHLSLARRNRRVGRLKLAYDYSSNLLQKVRDFNGSTNLWEATSTDAYGHIQNETFGNGVLTFTDFDQASGLMSAREGGVGGGTGLINSQVAWDLNGNLAQRQDLKLSPTQTEDFFYDSLNRLDRSNRNGAQNLDVTLDTIGNITSKGGLSYTYSGTQSGCSYYAHPQPRAVRKIGTSTVYCYDANGNMTKRAGSSIGYTSYNLPNVINSGSNSSTISYGAYRNRYKQVAVNAGATETTIYVAGLLAKVTRGSLIEYRHTIQGGNGMAAIHTRRSGGTPASDTVYVHQDPLGSPELITNASGGVVVRLSFGAYGERRDGTDWDGAVSAADLTTIGNTSRRGFTGHEHLDSVSLIHMNGRVYEPVAGRFLSVDPIVQLGSSQSPNSYSYVWNNPLTLIDPSGFIPDFPSCGPQDMNGNCNFPDLIGDIPGMSPHENGDNFGSPGGQGGSSIGGTKGGSGGWPGEGSKGQSKGSDNSQAEQQDPRCTMSLPDGSTVHANVNEMLASMLTAATDPRASDSKLFQVYGHWVGMVQEGGRWDYKLQRPGDEGEMLGNFNYGATGSLIFSSRTLLSAAGIVQLIARPSASDGGIPFARPPFGDQIADQNAIKAGITAGCR